MRKLDIYWKSNRQWWEFQNHIPTIRKDAPPEAQESYANYCNQIETMMQEQGMLVKEVWRIAEYSILVLEEELPKFPYNKYSIDGILYDIVPVYDMGNYCIAVKETSTDFLHSTVNFVLL